MKFTAILLALALSSTVYSKTPELPNPQEGKYSIQIIKVQTSASTDPLEYLENFKPENALYTTGAGTNQTHVFPHDSAIPSVPEKILEDPSSEIFEYPILYTVIGSSVTNDQTKTVLFPQDYKVEKGKAIPLDEKPIKLGLYIATTVTEQKNGVVDLHLDFYTNEIKGYDEYDVGSGVKVKMPFFDTRNIDTDVTIPLGGWLTLGGLKVSAEEEQSKNTVYFVRVI